MGPQKAGKKYIKSSREVWAGPVGFPDSTSEHSSWDAACVWGRAGYKGLSGSVTGHMADISSIFPVLLLSMQPDMWICQFLYEIYLNKIKRKKKHVVFSIY